MTTTETKSEFADKTTAQLERLQESLDYYIYEAQCYSLDDMSLLFRVNDEIERREKEEDEKETTRIA